MFSLQDYIGKYTGNTRIVRLQHIASKKEFAELHDDAMRMAIDIARTENANVLYK
jgi:COP9 signalosome complex subunit 1